MDNTVLQYQTLTTQLLWEFGCGNSNQWRAFVGFGMAITGENILAAHEAGLFDARWLAQCILTPTAWSEYQRRIEPGWMEFKRLTETAWTAYQSEGKAGHADYLRLTAQPWADYARAKIEALVAVVEASGGQ